MTRLLAEMTRDQIAAAAPNAVAVLPTASIEQHGPHMPILTDTLLCGTVARQAAERALTAPESVEVLVAPVLPYGNSHHHRPFAGVLSLSSGTYMAAAIDGRKDITDRLDPIMDEMPKAVVLGRKEVCALGGKTRWLVLTE